MSSSKKQSISDVGAQIAELEASPEKGGKLYSWSMDPFLSVFNYYRSVVNKITNKKFVII